MTQATSRKISEWPSTLTLLPNTAVMPLTSAGATYALPKEHVNPEIVAVLSATDTTGATNRARLQAAYDLLNTLGGGTLSIGPGTFKLSNYVQMYSNIHTRMSAGTVLDISASGSVDALMAEGTEGATMALTANALKGATSISLSAPDAATLSPQDWIRVASDAVFNASDTNSKIGEIVQVKTVSGTTVNLEAPLRGGAYNTANSATASKITFVTGITVEGGKILGGGTVTTTGSDADCNGIHIFLGQECTIRGVRFARCDLSGVWFRDSIFCQVRECHFQDAVNDNQGYGVLWDNACQDCITADCTGNRVRHLVTMGNSTNTKGITRRITYQGLKVYSTTTARGGTGGDAIDTHGAAEDLRIDNCTVYSSTGGGINVECASAQITNCDVFDTTDYGIIFHNESDQEGEVTISNCRVVNAGLGGTWEAIRVNMPTRGSTAANKSVVVANNRVSDCTGIGIYIVNSAGSGKQRNISVSGNSVIGAGSASASIYLEDVNGAAISGNIVCEPAQVAQQAFVLRDCSNLAITGNTVRHATSSTGVGFYVNASGAASCTSIVIEGNSVDCTTPSNLRGVVLDANATNVTIGKNNFQNCNTPFTRSTGSGHDVVDDLTLSVTIASDAITVNRNSREVVIDTEGGAATDNLSTINGGTYGQIICLRSANSARDPTIKHNVGNILCGADFTLATGNDEMTLVYCTSNHWRRIASSTN